MTDRWSCALRLLLPIAHVLSQICFADDSALETCRGLKLEDPPPCGRRTEGWHGPRSSQAVQQLQSGLHS
jgi:hypothetical protein